MEVKSMARVKYSYNIDGVSLSGLSSSNVVTTQVRQKNLLAKKIASSKFFKPLDLITYNIILSNTGNVDLNNIILNDEVKNQDLIYDTIEVYSLKENAPNVLYSYNNEVLTISLENLESDDVLVFSYKAVIKTNESSLTNNLEIICDDIENIKPLSVSLTKGFAEINCFKNVKNDFAYLNTNLTYELVLKNTGNVSAYNVEVFDELPVTYKIDQVLVDNNEIDYNLDNNVLSIILNEVKNESEVNILINGKIVK